MRRMHQGLPVFLLVLLLGLLLTAGPAAAEEITDTQGEMLTAENSRFQLYLTYEKGKTLQFSVRSRETGKVWRSSPESWETSADRKKRMQTGSQLVVTSMDKVSKATYTANSQVSSVGEEGTTVTLTEGGFRVRYDFPRGKDQYTVPVTYTLDEKGLRAELMMTEIEEYGDVYVQTVALLPNFFAGEPDARGYLLIPDGCGALIDFAGGRKGVRGYRQPVYGKDPALTSMQRIGQSMTATLPVLGIHTEGEGGVLMIAEENAALASACAFPAGTDTVYSAAWFEFTCRAADKMKLADKSWYATDVDMVSPEPNSRRNAAVLYCLLDGEDSGYAAMAGAYRDRLQESGGTAAAEAAPEIHLDVYGGIKKERSVLGVIVTDLLAMTTFDQAGEILDSLSASGADRVSMTFYGWNRGGLEDRAPSAARPEGKLGGEKGFRRLAQTAERNAAALLWDTDLLRIYRTDLTHNQLVNTAQTVTGDAAAQYVYQVSTYQKKENADPYYLLKPSLIAGSAESLLDGLAGEGVSFSSLGDTVYSDFAYGAYTDREETARIAAETLARAAEKTPVLAVTRGNAYALPRVTRVDHVPLFDSAYLCSATDVPFVPMALHGWKTMSSDPMNLSEEQDTFLLRLLETGVNPCFALTWQPPVLMKDTSYEYLMSTQWEQHRELILGVWQVWREAMDGLGDQRITGHEIAGDLRKTVYENGTRIYVNYGWEDGSLDGILIPARGWRVCREGEE